MKTIVCVAAFVLANVCAFTQKVKIFHEPKPNGYIIYGSTEEFYPVSVMLEFKLTNLKSSEAAGKVLVIPAKAEKIKLGELSVANPSARYNFSYNYKTAMGDLTLNNTDLSFEYELPFAKGQSFKVSQGYDGSFSHQKEYALDFDMREGTAILAAREGVVVAVVQNNTESCAKEECKKYNNSVTIMHADGSFAYYVHIKYNSAKFKLGDKVKAGDIIASSGNVGWSKGPHLHFVCFTGGFDKWNSFATTFKIDSGGSAVMLKEGMTYSRNY